MIQSMEILQLPILALQERIEQEMQENPVLDLREDDPDLPPETPSSRRRRIRPTPPPRRSANWSSTRRPATRTTSSG